MGDRPQSRQGRVLPNKRDDGRSPIARSLTDMLSQSTGQDKGKSKGQNKGKNKGKSKGQSNSFVQQFLLEQERHRDVSSIPQSRQERHLRLQSMNGRFIALSGHLWSDLVAGHEWENRVRALGEKEKRARRSDSPVQDPLKGRACLMNEPD